MRHRTWTAIALVLLTVSPAFAQSRLARQLRVEPNRTVVEFDAFAARAGTSLDMPLPGGRTARLQVQNVKPGAGSTILQAQAPGELPNSTELSITGAGAFGTIRANGRTYSVNTGADGLAEIIDLEAAGIREPEQTNDAIPAPAPEPGGPSQGDTAQAIPAGNAIVDIGMFYTPSMATRYGIGLAARFNALIDRLNLGLSNTNVPVSYLIGHIGPIDYAEATDNSDMLPDFRNGAGGMAHVTGIRVAKGLDIMSAHRAFDYPEHDGCGVGYVTAGGTNGGPITSAWRGGGWNIVSDGNAVGGENFGCSFNTTAHEVGHNMGLTHNREDASNPGVHSYSYGWRVPGQLRDIMAYPSGSGEMQYSVFSDPSVTICGGQPCGRPIGGPDEANNGESLRQQGRNVSLFYDRTSIGGELFASTLPSSRAVQVGATATAFATIINSGTTTATSCGIDIAGAPTGSFSYQTTDPATNQPVGAPNTPVSIPANGAQTFVFALNATATFNPNQIPVQFFCGNRRSATQVTGLNTLLFSASASARPDAIALALTPSSDGILNISGVGQAAAFVAAISNVGSTGAIRAAPSASASGVAVALSICQTNPSGACLSSPNTFVDVPSVPAGGTASFAIFATATGAIPFDPAGRRIFVTFTNGSSTVGQTSVAMRTP